MTKNEKILDLMRDLGLMLKVMAEALMAIDKRLMKIEKKLIIKDK